MLAIFPGCARFVRDVRWQIGWDARKISTGSLKRTGFHSRLLPSWDSHRSLSESPSAPTPTMNTLLVSCLILSVGATDWGAWLKEGANNLAKEAGYEDFDTAVEGANKFAQDVGHSAVQAMTPPPAVHQDPYLSGHGCAAPDQYLFSNWHGRTPYSGMYGCAPNANENRKMCWATAGDDAEYYWCWINHDCAQHSDCQKFEPRYERFACYGSKFRKGTDRNEYNDKMLAERGPPSPSKSGL